MQWVFLEGAQELVMAQLDHIEALEEMHIKEWILLEDKLLLEQEDQVELQNLRVEEAHQDFLVEH
jgi:hypothetical protein